MENNELTWSGLHTKNRCAEITHNRCVILAQFGMLNVSAKIIITQLLCCFYTPVCYFTNYSVVLAHQCVLLTHKSVKILTHLICPQI